MTAYHRPLDESDIRLIEQVQRAPCLYDSRNPDFRLANKKEQQWDQVAELLGMTQWEARKRWTCLRDRYVRELKQTVLHPGRNKFGKSSFFQQMDFLRAYVKKRKQRHNSKGNSLSSKNCLKYMEFITTTMNNFEENTEPTNFESHCHQHPVMSPIQTIDSTDSERSTDTKFPYLSTNHAKNSLETDNYSEYMNDIQGSYVDYDEKQILNGSEQLNCVSNRPLPTEAEVILTQTPLCVESSETLGSTLHIQNIGSNTDTFGHNISQLFRPDLESPKSPQLHDSEEFFARIIASYLKQLSRRHNIKAKVEMMQILEKYVEMEEATRH